MRVRVFTAWMVLTAVACGAAGRALADDVAPSIAVAPADDLALSDERVLGHERGFHVDSITTRVSGYNQFGTGYQSKSGPILGPGSERLTVFEPQAEIIASQGDRVTHRIWVPVDIISSASANSIPKVPDVVSGASRHNGAGTIEWATTYRSDAVTQLSMNTGVHLESPFRSWNGGLGASRAFAEQNTVLSFNVVGIFDWFDRFEVNGRRDGRTERSSTLGSISFTQVLGPDTVVNVNYGLTVQAGELGNTWNAVPLTSGIRGSEILPDERVRHALVGHLSQFLPWNGALKLYERFYADDWGIVANSAAAELLQRLSPELYVGALYRFHVQNGPSFFTTLASPNAALRTADSDLAPLDSHTIGGKVVGDVPVTGVARSLHYEVEYDRYFRTNDLRIDIVTCALGFHF